MGSAIFFEIMKLLTADQIESAQQLLKSSSELLTDETEADFLSGVIAERTGDWEKAKAIYSKLFKAPDPPLRVVERLTRSLIKLKDYDEALALIPLAEQKGAPRILVLHMKVDIAEGRLDWPQSIEYLREMITLEPESPRFHIRLIRALFACEQTDNKYAYSQQIKQLSEEALAKWPENDTLKNFHARILRKTRDSDTMLDNLENAFLSDKKNVMAAIKYIRGLQWHSKNTKAKKIFLEIIETSNTSTRLLNLGGDLTWSAEEAEIIYQRVLTLLNSPKKPQPSSLGIIRLLMCLGKWEKAKSLVREMPDYDLENDAEEHVATLRALTNLLQNFTPPSETPPHIFENDETDIFIHKAAGTRSTLLVFTGWADMITVPLPIIHPAFSSLKTNIVYVRDPTRTLYLGGVASLGSNYDETINKLREILQDIGTENLYCLGTSAGGFAAVRYGIDLSATSALSLSGPTNPSKTFTQKYDGRASAIVDKISSSYSDEEVDLRYIISHASTVPPIYHYHCANNTVDKHHAMNISEFPSVVLRTVPDASIHASLLILLERSQLLNVMKEVFNL